MKHCEWCATEFEDSARFCGSCGHPLHPAEARVITKARSDSLLISNDAASDISKRTTTPLPDISSDDTIARPVWIDGSRMLQSMEAAFREDIAEEEEDHDVLVGAPVVLMPDMPATPPIGSIPTIGGTPSISNAPMVPGTPGGPEPPSSSAPTTMASPHTPLPAGHQPSQKPPIAHSHHARPGSDTRNLDSAHSNADTRNLHQAQTQSATHDLHHLDTQQPHYPQTPSNTRDLHHPQTQQPRQAQARSDTQGLQHPNTHSTSWQLHHPRTDADAQNLSLSPHSPSTRPLQHSHTGSHPNTRENFVELEARSGRKERAQHARQQTTTRPAQNKKRKRRTLALVALLLIACLLLLLTGGPLVLARIFPGGPTPATSATVTITPSSSDQQNAFAISIVTGTPDASQHQVGGARILTATTSSFSQTAKATGQGTIPGTQASGTLQVENHDTTSTLTITAGSVFPNQLTPAIHMQFDQTVTIPPGGFTQVPAHVVEAGTIGNLPGPCCGPGPNFQNQCNGIDNCGQAHDMFNGTAFTGGTDPQTYSVVRQSDIDGATQALEQANTPNAQQLLQSQVQANEQFIGNPQCKPNVTSDHAGGDKATSVTVTVTFSCSGEVYEQQEALSMARELLSTQATTNLGSLYALVGNITTSVTGVTLANAGQGTVALTINTEGIWVYQFSPAQEQALTKLMANKQRKAVQTLLLKQPGVATVTMHLVGGDGTLFPADPRQIKLVVQNVPGL